MRAAVMALSKVLAREGGLYNVIASALMTGLIVSDQVAALHRCGRANPCEAKDDRSDQGSAAKPNQSDPID
jgi:NAD(P)-dependent dehydrogenase (short-subunit alcohol dehydrogenase family)